MVAPVGPELLIERIFEAPRSLVWNAWADPKQMIQWMGPRDHPSVLHESDTRIGGKWRGCLKGPLGDLWQGGEYREIVEPERIVFTFYWVGDDGKPENVMLIKLIFEEMTPRKTKMMMIQTEFRDVDQRDRHRGGWTSTFDRLEEFLEKKA